MMKFFRAPLSLITLIMLGALVACLSVPRVKHTSALADGTYVFSIAGQDATVDFLYYVTGVFKVSGGAIVGGEQDFVDFTSPTLSDQIIGGSSIKTADGNLKITLRTLDKSIGVDGVETFHATMVSSTGSKALINEFDSFATSSGQLELQTATALPPGGYAFFLTGGDSGGAVVAFGGVANVDGANTISGAGSVFDFNNPRNGIVLQNQPIDPSTISGPDAFGRIKISLDLTTSTVGGLGLVGYVVDNNHIRLVENNNDPMDVSFNGSMGGTAFAQGGNTGTFSAASIAGSSFVIGTTGEDPNGFFQAAGVVTANADLTTVSGTINFNDLTGIGAQTPIAFTGTYTVDPTGRVTVQDTTDGFTIQMYLDGNGNGTVATMDSLDVLAGQAYMQTGAGSFSAGSFSGSYGLDATGTDSSFLQVDSVGPVTADGISSLTGTVDQNSLSTGTPAAGVALTGDFVGDPSGVFTTSTGIQGLDVLNPGNQDAFTYYLIDNQRAVAIETDPNQLTLGYFELVH